MLSYKDKRKIATNGLMKLIRKTFKKKSVSQILAICFLLIFPGAFLLLTTSYQLVYHHRIYPGIKIADCPVGAQTLTEARQQLELLINNRLNKQNRLLLINENQTFELDLKKLKLNYRLEQTIKKAYQHGRSETFWQNSRAGFSAWKKGFNLFPEYDFDETYLKQQIASLSAQVLIPAIEPSIEIVQPSIKENSRIVVHAGQTGQELDHRLLNLLLRERLAKIDLAPLELPLLKVAPALTSEEIEKIKTKAQKLLGKKITLVFEEKKWTLEEKELINLLDLNEGFDQFKIHQYVNSLAESINHPAQDATFQFRENRVVEFRPAREGRALDIPAASNLIIENLQKADLIKEEVILLPVISVKPAITTADANDLGIRELIGRGESWFAGSILSRIHNLTLASTKLNGLLIAPGQEFSLNQVLGEISETTGYQKAYIIKAGRTVLGDGGGVCQASTTLFRAVLSTGLPVLERHAHAYRVSYYEQNSAVGLDATIYDPTADLKFKNDTGAFILIQTKVDTAAKKLTYDFYGTADGRKAILSPTRIWDQLPPPPALYQEDPNLPSGTTKQIDWPAWGSKTAFDWQVTRDGEILHEQTFYSYYRPWQAIYLVGKKP
ncbi:MAG: VanW family protein [Candidatus Pacebacteria bacterium]|nr:VanW family protein [Candidatus Paceibacterota bacterium]